MKNKLIYSAIVFAAVGSLAIVAHLTPDKKVEQSLGATSCPELDTSISTDEYLDLVEMWNKAGIKNVRNISCWNERTIKMNDKLENLSDNEIRDKVLGVGLKSSKNTVEEVREFKNMRDDIISKIEKRYEQTNIKRAKFRQQ